MKKKNWLANIALMVLAICLMSFGVYAAQTASLTMTGTVGFIAHNCEVTAVGTIANAMRGEAYDYAKVATATYTQDDDSVWADSFTTIETADGELVADDYLGNETWNFGDVYFDDVNESTNNQDIVFTITLHNYSDYAVRVTLAGELNSTEKYENENGEQVPVITGVAAIDGATYADASVYTIAADAEVVVTVTFTLNAEIDSTATVNPFTINVAKYVA